MLEKARRVRASKGIKQARPALRGLGEVPRELSIFRWIVNDQAAGALRRSLPASARNASW